MELLTKDDLSKIKIEIIQEVKKIISPVSLENPEFLRTSQVKELLGCSESKIETLRKNGTLPFQKVGGSIYYKYSDIKKLFN
ncbi:MAG: helix-turn-helix domain-containing protein [Sediminibacterium sp. Gen4]|jgi:excisionase family DNA binding protein|uniref:helix-turn-helix transcriptional regulator n=1 Tax=unclassified Sediminibacterium TaxID=2635961 RepID=UPI0015BDAD27|nr:MULTISPECIES: helix-turn-helix domain-containing protein [unclassified Sediminibacterium]MBW0160418.1 helix-turn-helix domain-containing protein [Sediminibacterium sp.]MBW0163041.1 helix-turn-helix domain-containing protein [Sediminibacterium sp.]NWK66359.1 helix-turn-helix domain-containing protein [Sediminibacterium sp. Gen4]